MSTGVAEFGRRAATLKLAGIPARLSELSELAAADLQGAERILFLVSTYGEGDAPDGAAGFAGYMVLLFASIALWWGLSNVMDQGWAALIVTALWAVIGAVLFVVGRGRLKQVNPTPERTVETVKELPDALKPARS